MPLYAIPFPDINPVLISVGPLAIRWYALAYIAGILIGWWYLRRVVVADRLWGSLPRPTPLELDDFVVWATLGIILGGRLGYVIFYNPAHYLADPYDIPQLWNGGMSFHGGLVGSIVAMWWFTRGRAFSLMTLFDLFSAAAPIGLLFGRLANFIKPELWGRPTDVAWAMVFPGAGPLPRHPSQLYEAGLEGIVLFAVLAVMIWNRDALKRPGTIAGTFGIGYGLARIFVEFFREPDAQLGYLLGFVTMGQILSLPLVIAGAGLLIWSARRRTAIA
ncbi:prolipoprotein diacylglyceryl transferase [Methyloraptor flagellatus]|uniref:Phosphatidylglycerol--prolipoprotein diacylglyceryl transferase n=1 Tax=Methyloraptor flagellatus TaxID=3162530 RepID=A0AAU7XB93_9HYPH